MTSAPATYPQYRPVADRALLVEFGDRITREAHDQVRRLDQALSTDPFDGFGESVPAYVGLLVTFDPMATDHETVMAAIDKLLRRGTDVPPSSTVREVLVCYEDELAPDLEQVAAATGLSREQVIAAHLGGDYSVFMYGFAPGYAYLAGVPTALQLPRKPSAIRGIPAGAVLIAGPQCLVTTITMPTGWWIIGRSPTPILRSEAERPFLFDVGDGVRFRRIDRATFDAAMRAAG